MSPALVIKLKSERSTVSRMLYPSVVRIKKTDASKLQDEYLKLVEGLQQADQDREEDTFMANPGMSHTQAMTSFLDNRQCSRMI